MKAQSWKSTFAALFIAGIAGCGLWPSTALSRSVTPLPRISASERRLCSAVSRLEAKSQTTTVYVPRDATYRDIGRVLNAAESHSRWNGRRTPRPSDTAPGFLTALDRLMRATATATTPNSRPTGRSFAYVYKDAVYDLVPRHVDHINELRMRSGTFHDLLRSEMVIRNRATGSTSFFSITYGTRGSMTGVPVTAAVSAELVVQD